MRKTASACGSKTKALQVEPFLRYAEQKILRDKWSPDAIVGAAKRENKFEQASISILQQKCGFLFNYTKKLPTSFFVDSL